MAAWKNGGYKVKRTAGYGTVLCGSVFICFSRKINAFIVSHVGGKADNIFLGKEKLRTIKTRVFVKLTMLELTALSELIFQF